MAHVVTSKCQGCKFTDCVEVCPVSCFYELENQLIIDPHECIDCTACVSECPVEAIYSENDLPDQWKADANFNAAQIRIVKDSWVRPLLQRQQPLPTSAERRAALGY